MKDLGLFTVPDILTHINISTGPGDSIETERVEIGSNNLEWILKLKYDTERVGIRRDRCQLQDIC